MFYLNTFFNKLKPEKEIQQLLPEICHITMTFGIQSTIFMNFQHNLHIFNKFFTQLSITFKVHKECTTTVND